MAHPNPLESDTGPREGREISLVPTFDTAFKAFISYSQKADGVFASVLERELERFAKAWYRRRAFDVFRDASSLSANPALWPVLQKTLDDTEHLILLASPESAASPWVRRELAHWLASKGRDKVLFVLTGGEIAWNDDANDFDWSRTTSLRHEVFAGTFPHAPLWIDATWSRGRDAAALRRDEKLPDAVASIAATLHNRPKSDLFGDDLRQHRRQIRTAQIAIALLAVLLVAALGFWRQSHRRGNDLAASLVNETMAKNDAEKKARIATSRQLAALSVGEREVRMDRSLLLAAEALRSANTFEARDSLHEGLRHRPGLSSLLHVPERSVLCVAFSPDRRTFAAGYGKNGAGGVVLFDAASRRRLAEGPLAVPEGVVVSLSFSHDGKTLAAGYRYGKAGDGGVVLVEVESWHRSVQTPLAVGEGAVSSVAFSPDGKTLAVGFIKGRAGGVVLFDAASYRRQAETLAVGEAPVSCVIFSKDSKTLAAGYGQGGGGGIGGFRLEPSGGVVLFDAASRRRLAEAPLVVGEGEVVDVAFDPNGKCLAAGYDRGSDGGVVLFDPTSRRRLADAPLAVGEGSVSCVAFSPDGKTIVAGYGGLGRLIAGRFGGGGVAIFDTADRKRLKDLKYGRRMDAETRREAFLDDPLVVIEGDVTSVAFSHDGRTLAVGYREGSGADAGGAGVALFDTSGRGRLEVRRLPITEGRVKGIASSTDGRTLAAGFEKETVGEAGRPIYLGGVLLLDATSHRRLFETPLPVGEGGVTCVAFRRDGRALAAGFVNRGVISGVVLFDPMARRRIIGEFLAIEEGAVESVAFSPDGRTLAVSYSTHNSGGVVLFDAESRRRLAEAPLDVGEGKVSCVAFSPDGKALAAGYYVEDDLPGGVVYFDVANRRRLYEAPRIVSRRGVRCVAFSHDGQSLAAGFGNLIDGRGPRLGGIVLFDATGHVRPAGGGLDIDFGNVRSVSFSPDDRTIAAGWSAFDSGGTLLFEVAGRRRLFERMLDYSGIEPGVAFGPDGKTLAVSHDVFAGGSDLVVLDVDLESWTRIAGRVANRNFTLAERQRYFPDEPPSSYRRTFRDLPWPADLPLADKREAEIWESNNLPLKVEKLTSR